MTYEMQVWEASRNLWRHALKLTRSNVVAAEDIMSEAVISALTTKTRPDEIQAWLYRALRSKFLDGKRKGYTYLKDASNGPRLVFTDTLPDTQQDICTPEAILIAKQGLRRALAAQKVSKPKTRTRVHKNAKLTDAEVIYIRGAGRNRPTKHLMAQFGVGFDTIARIRKGLSYAHIQEASA